MVTWAMYTKESYFMLNAIVTQHALLTGALCLYNSLEPDPKPNPDADLQSQSCTPESKSRLPLLDALSRFFPKTRKSVGWVSPSGVSVSFCSSNGL
ncbi:unnamed protein product [Periconia digitata]|uniref:Uncharacterized protein n=1 Tax=Periconia digitata TaxID=1303443 RepID=A0A9W4UH68_9PLEO|nr:unnamed protein product [Periconia digitata]